MSEPLTPEEEAALRERLASGHALGLFQMSIGIRDLVARLLATLDAARAATPEWADAEDLDRWLLHTAPLLRDEYVAYVVARVDATPSATPAAPEAHEHHDECDCGLPATPAAPEADR